MLFSLVLRQRDPASQEEPAATMETAHRPPPLEEPPHLAVEAFLSLVSVEVKDTLDLRVRIISFTRFNEWC